jgi:hypothetical protein
MINSCTKIGEGSYGEVFRAVSADYGTVALKVSSCDYPFNAKSPVFQVVPVEGNVEVNGAVPKTFAEILPEVIIGRELSDLKDEYADNSTPNFIELLSTRLVKGTCCCSVNFFYRYQFCMFISHAPSG